MKANLYEMKNGRATITKHCYTIARLKEVIDTYGEVIAAKVFTVYEYMSDLNPDTNPFANIDEGEKLEFIIRHVCPDLPLDIDWLDDLYTDGIELTRKCFETPSYREYLAKKALQDKLNKTIHDTYVSVSRDDGNITEIDRAIKMSSVVGEAVKKAYSEFEAENGSVQRKGGRRAVTRTIGGKANELE